MQTVLLLKLQLVAPIFMRSDWHFGVKRKAKTRIECFSGWKIVFKLQLTSFGKSLVKHCNIGSLKLLLLGSSVKMCSFKDQIKPGMLVL